FFFQAEDGIRDLIVTGVQTCALPIFIKGARRIIEDFRPAILLETDHLGRFGSSKADVLKHFDSLDYSVTEMPGEHSLDWLCLPRSEERRVGKECSCGMWKGVVNKREG